MKKLQHWLSWSRYRMVGGHPKRGSGNRFIRGKWHLEDRCSPGIARCGCDSINGVHHKRVTEKPDDNLCRRCEAIFNRLKRPQQGEERMSILLLSDIETIGQRHGQDLIDYTPPAQWHAGRGLLPLTGARDAYDRGYILGLQGSYKGDLSPRCPKCGYNAIDQERHGDHRYCDGEIPTQLAGIASKAHQGATSEKELSQNL